MKLLIYTMQDSWDLRFTLPQKMILHQMDSDNHSVCSGSPSAFFLLLLHVPRSLLRIPCSIFLSSVESLLEPSHLQSTSAAFIFLWPNVPTHSSQRWIVFHLQTIKFSKPWRWKTSVTLKRQTHLPPLYRFLIVGTLFKFAVFLFN